MISMLPRAGLPSGNSVITLSSSVASLPFLNRAKPNRYASVICRCPAKRSWKRRTAWPKSISSAQKRCPGCCRLVFNKRSASCGETAWGEKAGFDEIRTNAACVKGQVTHPRTAFRANHRSTRWCDSWADQDRAINTFTSSKTLVIPVRTRFR